MARNVYTVVCGMYFSTGAKLSLCSQYREPAYYHPCMLPRYGRESYNVIYSGALLLLWQLLYPLCRYCATVVINSIGFIVYLSTYSLIVTILADWLVKLSIYHFLHTVELLSAKAILHATHWCHSTGLPVYYHSALLPIGSHPFIQVNGCSTAAWSPRQTVHQVGPASNTLA